jgi:hypothetical protein
MTRFVSKRSNSGRRGGICAQVVESGLIRVRDEMAPLEQETRSRPVPGPVRRD